MVGVGLLLLAANVQATELNRIPELEISCGSYGIMEIKMPDGKLYVFGGTKDTPVDHRVQTRANICENSCEDESPIYPNAEIPFFTSREVEVYAPISGRYQVTLQLIHPLPKHYGPNHKCYVETNFQDGDRFFDSFDSYDLKQLKRKGDRQSFEFHYEPYDKSVKNLLVDELKEALGVVKLKGRLTEDVDTKKIKRFPANVFLSVDESKPLFNYSFKGKPFKSSGKKQSFGGPNYSELEYDLGSRKFQITLRGNELEAPKLISGHRKHLHVYLAGKHFYGSIASK